MFFPSIFEPIERRFTPPVDPFFRSITPLIQNMNRVSMPIELYTKDNKYFIKAEAPGIDPEALDITVDNDILSIDYVKTRGAKNDDGDYTEFEYGKYSRRIRLPEKFDKENINADYRDGVIIITAPELDSVSTSRKIEVNYDNKALEEGNSDGSKKVDE